MKVGATLAERYEILRPLGAGGGGEVWLARDLRDGHPVALKTLALKGSEPSLQEAFRRECEILARLDHPHIAHLLDFGQEQDLLYYVSEYVEGGDLVSEARTRHWDAVLQLVVQASWALDYLHRSGVIHRDLKPANLLVGKLHSSREGDEKNRLNLKLIDFGLALEAVAQLAKAGPTGTLRYLAPELLQGKAGDARSDLFSFGVLLYEMCLGRLPELPAKNFSSLLKILESGRLNLAPLEKSDTPQGLIQVIRSLVVADPAERLPDARSIIALINRVEHESFPLEAPSAAAPPSPAPLPEILGGGTPLERLRALTRAGRRVEAWQFAEPILKNPGAFAEQPEWEHFIASALHLLIDQGRYAEVERYLPLVPHGTQRDLTEMFLGFRRGEFSVAEKVSERLVARMNELSAEERGRFEYYRAFLAQAQKNPERAAEHLAEAILWAQRSGRVDHQASLESNAGALATDGGRWTEAYRHFQNALGLSRATDNRSQLATVLNNLGNLYLYFGRFSDAEAALFESLQIAREQELRPLIAYNLYLLTVAEEGKGNWEKVEQYLEEALRYAEELGDSQPILQAMLGKGYFLLGRKNFSECRRVLQELRERCAAVNSEYYGLQADWLEAKLLLQSGEVPEYSILKILDRVETDATQRKNSAALWQVAADRGDFFRAQDETEAARMAYRSSLELMRERLDQIPQIFHDSYFRDRKKERIRLALDSMATNPPAASAEPLNQEVLMSLEPPNPTPSATDTFSFQKWEAINRRILRQDRLQPLLEEILDAAVELTDAERGFVIYSEEGEFQIQAARNLDRETLEREEEKFSKTIAQEVLRKGEAQIITDAVADERFSMAKSVHALQLRSVLCVPLHAGQKTVGLIYLDNRIREGVFRPQHLPLLKALADQASLALEHTRLHNSNRDKIEELKNHKATIEKLNRELEKRLAETATDLNATRENLRRQNEEIAVKYTYHKIIGEGPLLKKVLLTLDKVVDSSMNVFICGESGTGKELIAQAIHYNGQRKSFSFVAVNCSALPENLLESELFGHAKGAFTGAEQDKVGLFSLAHLGTLFLDEVGDMPLAMQAKLLRVLQEGEVRPVGGDRVQKVDVRIVSASNKDLLKLVESGKFRQDLYYRLHVARIDLPPLRERREDIPLLVRHFLNRECEKVGCPVPKITRGALKLLLNYPWPGNIRELQNEIQRCLTLSSGKEISAELLSPQIVEGPSEPAENGDLRLDPWVGQLEKRLITRALHKARGNKVKTAKLLKIGRRTLYAKLRRYGLGTEK